MKKSLYLSIFSFLLAGCSPPNPESFVQKEVPADPVSTPVDEAPSMIRENEPLAAVPEPAVLGSASEPALPPKAAAGDWDARGKELMAEFIEGFHPPALESITEVTLSSGTVIQGKAKALGPDSVTMEMAQGEITYSNANLAPASRVKLFARDYAFMKAKMQVDRERAEFTAAQQQAKMVKEKEAGVSVPRNAADGSVWQVLEYLKHNLRDPQNFRALEWGRVQPDRGGYLVTLKYQTTAGSLGVITEHKYFFMDPTGKVYQTAAMKGGN